LGAFDVLSPTKTLRVGYNFAGGIEPGSPVRVMGIKVGSVKAIDFTPDAKSPDGEEVKLTLTISIHQRAWSSVRRDSKFFINLAGVIGEKFLEITPGTTSADLFSSGDFVRGEDPPRIDQLISQSYGLAGKVIELLEKNEGSVADTIEKLNSLVQNLNRTLVLLEKTSQNKEFTKLVSNIVQISDDVLIATSKLRGTEAEKTMALLHQLIWRLEKLDEEAIKKFFQKDGIKAKLF
jgi:phospholipid/cholesterol/gamma-HCH transport system substrate-binding protein